MTMRLSYTSANGSVYPLDGSDGIQCVNLIDGLTTIPTDLLIDQRVAADGGTISNERRGPRRMMLDFMIASNDKLAVMSKWAGLQTALAAGGKFVFDGANGLRELREVFLESATRDVGGPNDDDIFSTSLIALDPYWYGSVVEVDIDLTGGDTAWNEAGMPWNADEPWNGGSSIVVNVTGDVPAFPMFVAGGGMDSLLVALGGDQTVYWQIDFVLPSDFAMTIDHRPGHRGPHLGADLVPGYTRGPVNWGLLSEDSRVTWPLPLGSTSIVTSVVGDTPGVTFLKAFWEPRWLTP